MAKSNAAAKKDHAPRQERHERPYPANDDRARQNRRYHQNDDGPTPVGFGDDVPAFMLTSAALKG